MSSTRKQVWNRVSTALVVLVVAVVMLLVGVRLFGIHPYTVLSGSMEPDYPVGSLVYVWSKADPLKLRVGQPVTFMVNETTVVTHVIVEVIPDDDDTTVVRFRTQGIANDDPDEGLVHSKNVIGKPLFCIPYLGYVAEYLQTPKGRLVSFGACAVLMLVMLILPVFERKQTEGPPGEGEEPIPSEQAPPEERKKSAEAAEPKGPPDAGAPPKESGGAGPAAGESPPDPIEVMPQGLLINDPKNQKGGKKP